MNVDDGNPEGWCDEGILVSGTNKDGYEMTYESLIRVSLIVINLVEQ